MNRLQLHADSLSFHRFCPVLFRHNFRLPKIATPSAFLFVSSFTPLNALTTCCIASRPLSPPAATACPHSCNCFAEIPVPCSNSLVDLSTSWPNSARRMRPSFKPVRIHVSSLRSRRPSKGLLHVAVKTRPYHHLGNKKESLDAPRFHLRGLTGLITASPTQSLGCTLLPALLVSKVRFRWSLHTAFTFTHNRRYDDIFLFLC